MSAAVTYGAYSDSGVGCIGRIPSSWGMTRLKLLVEEDRPITYGIVQAGPNVEGGIPYIRPADMSDESGVADFGGLLRTSEEIASSYRRSAIDGGDLVCSIGPSFGKVMVVPEELRGGNLTQGTARVTISRMNSPRFYFWALRSSGAFQQWESSVGGATFRALNLRPLAETRLPHPSFEEQTQIAKFLDYETAKIDALIEKQQQLIALLKEKRQAVISHAVTKGLNPDAPMRDSGVEWLGEVPAHWKVSKFGYVSSVVRGGSPRPAGDPTLFDGDYSPWVTVAEVTKDDEITLTETATFLTKKGSIQCRVFKAGTLLISNSGATLGVPKVLMIDANANDGVVGFEDLRHQREFCYYYLSSLTEDLRERIKQGSGQPNLNTDIVKALAVPVPPTDEVDAILRHISEQREKFKQLTEKAGQGIDLLQERRTALISAAVTGKIDVRNWQPPESEPEAAIP